MSNKPENHLLAFCCWASDNNPDLTFNNNDKKLYDKLMEYFKLNNLDIPNALDVEKILKKIKVSENG